MTSKFWMIVLFFAMIFIPSCIIEEDCPECESCYKDSHCLYSYYCGLDGYCHPREGSSHYYGGGTDSEYRSGDNRCDDDWECPEGTSCVNSYCFSVEASGGGCFNDADCPSRTICDLETGGCKVPECHRASECGREHYDCNYNHECVPATITCVWDRECPEGQQCLHKYCITFH